MSAKSKPITSGLLKGLADFLEPGESATFEIYGTRIEFVPRPDRALTRAQLADAISHPAPFPTPGRN